VSADMTSLSWSPTSSCVALLCIKRFACGVLTSGELWLQSYGGGPHPGQQQPGGPQHGPQSPQQPRLQRPPGGGGRGGSHQQGQPQHPASMQPGQQPQPGPGQQPGRGGGQPAAAPKVVQPPPRRTLKLVDPKTGESLDLSAARKEAAAKVGPLRKGAQGLCLTSLTSCASF
jgi:hypothetical protein